MTAAKAETSELAAALVKVQADLPTIVKGETAEVPTKAGGKYSYTYADLHTITDALMPLLSGNGLAFTATPHLRDDGHFVLRCDLRHISGETVTGDYPLSLQGGPQAQGSAITYARRYALCAMTGVAPDDDDGQAAQKAASEPNRAPQQASPEDLADVEAAIAEAAAAKVDLPDTVAEVRRFARIEGKPGNAAKIAARIRELIAEKKGGEPDESNVPF